MKQHIMHKDVARVALIGGGIGVVLIAFLSLAPRDLLPSTGMSDKLEHFIAYFTLAALVVFGFANRSARRAFIVVVFYSLILEGFQGLMRIGRTPSFADVMTSTAGAISGACIGMLGWYLLNAMIAGKDPN